MKIDRMYNVDVEEVNHAAFRVLHHVQQLPTPALVTGVAWLFLSVCERYGLEPRRVLEVSERVRRDALDRRPVQARAIRRFLREELSDA